MRGGRGDRDDATLVAAVRGGDLGALRELYDRHAPWLSARLTRRCSDPDVVADALQDCFQAVWTQAGRWRGEGEVAAWLWGIAIRSLLHHLRPRANVIERLSRLRGGDAVSAEEQVLARVEYSDVGAALHRLSPELRAVVQATVIDGLTTREAATLLGIPSGTVKSRMSRARHELREALL